MTLILLFFDGPALAETRGFPFEGGLSSELDALVGCSDGEGGGGGDGNGGLEKAWRTPPLLLSLLCLPQPR